ncbi:hypothetical protein DRJ17_02995 [Candidatus Woesearchaeota archaeon]|nr:MAG: hypothetical protein DRJ17_02995 [Candidatus Woesearchaeota archaeon]
MVIPMIKPILEDLGLTKNEIAVYLALNKIGNSTVSSIIKQAKISSGKIYETLDKLIDKGLVSVNITNNTKHFQATNLQRLEDYAKEKENEWRLKQKAIQGLLPQISKLRIKKEKIPSVRMYVGLKGFKNAVYDALDCMKKGEVILGMGITSKKQNKALNTFWLNFSKERIRRRIKVRNLFSEKESEFIDEFKKMKYTENRYLENITPNAVDIFGDTVLIFSYEKTPSVVTIEDENVAISFKAFFNSLWKIANKL